MFARTDDGGIESVLAKDPGDLRNIGLIRSHLQTEAVSFRKGDYSDPARIHGMDMPGVTELEAGASRVAVRYEPLPNGALRVPAPPLRPFEPPASNWGVAPTPGLGYP